MQSRKAVYCRCFYIGARSKEGEKEGGPSFVGDGMKGGAGLHIGGIWVSAGLRDREREDGRGEWRKVRLANAWAIVR